MRTDRAQAIILKGTKVLMVKHSEIGKGDFWCLPGGGVETDEKPEEAVLRELNEETRIEGEIIRKLATIEYWSGEKHHTFYCKIIVGSPKLGYDPELSPSSQVLRDVQFIDPDELSEIDRSFLMQSGLLAIQEMDTWVRRREGAQQGGSSEPVTRPAGR